MLFAQQEWFEKKELFASIRAEGFQIDDSLLEELQKQGVMPPPVRRGKGRAKGNHGLWSRQQRDLLRTFCMMRERHHIRQVASRCNLPVWIWLYWGDAHGITLEHVQRVMKSWASHQPAPSLKVAKQSAKELTTVVANYAHGGKRQAIRELTNLFYTEMATPQAVTESLHHVFDPAQPANGPHDIPILPENLGAYIGFLQSAKAALVSGQAIPDIQWQWARCFHLYHVSQYAQQQQGYARETVGSSVEQIFSIETIESLWSSACADLAAVLGLGLHYPVIPGLPEQLRLDAWKNRVQSATVTSKEMRSPLFLPDGTIPRYLEICETVTLK